LPSAAQQQQQQQLLLLLFTAVGLLPGGSGYFTYIQNMNLFTTTTTAAKQHIRSVTLILKRKMKHSFLFSVNRIAQLSSFWAMGRATGKSGFGSR